jgi:hypothetical protein
MSYGMREFWFTFGVALCFGVTALCIATIWIIVRYQSVWW